MTDLPTRKEAQGVAFWIPEVNEQRVSTIILRAYAEGVLLTAEEWRDATDYEAMAKRVRSATYALNDWSHEQLCALMRTAVGGDS